MRIAFFLTFLPALLYAQEHVSFPSPDGGLVHGLLYGKGSGAVVLAHGGRFNKESWDKQSRTLAQAGFRVLAIDFRGYGLSTGPGHAEPLSAPLHFDVLAAVRYLRKTGARKVTVVGGSMGGAAAADAAILAEPGEIHGLVMLGSAGGSLPTERLRCRKLVILTRDDASGDGLRLPGFERSFNKLADPKKMILLDGSAHAQFLFQSDHAERVVREIVKFVSER